MRRTIILAKSVLLLVDFSFVKIENPGIYYGLTLHLSPQQDLYYGFQAAIAGFKVHIHNQGEPPLIRENGFAVMPGTSTFVAVTIKQVRSTETFRVI